MVDRYLTVQEIPYYYGITRYITVTTICCLSIYEPVQSRSYPHYLLCCYSPSLFLSPKWLLSMRYSTKTLHLFFCSLIFYMYSPPNTFDLYLYSN